MMNKEQLIAQIKEKHSYLCVGLDTDLHKIPAHLASKPDGIIAFNKAIIEATKEHCIAYKINTAFYETMGTKGWEAIEATLEAIPSTHFAIADAKRGDIGNTSAQYAKTFFETYPFDAVTVAPYMGEDSIRPFLEYENKFAIVLGLTSNQGATDFQQLIVEGTSSNSLIPNIIKANRPTALYEKVIEKIAQWGNPNNLMFVIGATRATELEHIRNIVPDNFLLIPGVGAQGGSLAEVSKYGLNKEVGLLVNASRAIIYASNGEDFAEKAAFAAAAYASEMKNYL